MGSRKEEIFWDNTPKWDNQNKGWYWSGQEMRGGQLRPVAQYLRPDEFGADGYPHESAAPPPSSAPQQPLGTLAPQSGNLGTLGPPQGQQVVDNYAFAFGSGNPAHPTGSYNPDAAFWSPGSGKAAYQMISPQGPTSFVTSSTKNREAQQYGAQVHQGASWAGGPSLPPIRVREKARGKIKQVPQASKDMLDSNFDIYPSTDFQPGRIIKVWWSEPQGMPTRGAFGSRLSKPGDTLLSDHKKAIWTGFRRFIIIRNFEGHCHGIPIYTYGGQGCTKHGVKCHEHGAIYENSPGSTAGLLANEKPLGFPPIRARTTNGEPMKNTSRVNYAKVADIGHNLMVNFIAEVVPEDWVIARDALRQSGFC